MLGSPRDSGLPAVGPVAWGTHLCHFYKTADDLRETLVPYFKAGLEQNERCLWITSEPLGAEDARAALRAVAPRLEAQMAAGQIEIIDHQTWYARLGRVGAAEVIAGWLAHEEQALARGYAGLRLTGDFRDYEERANEVFSSRSILALCSYSTERCGSEGVLDVVHNHQRALVRRGDAWEVIENGAELAHHGADFERRVHERTAELEAALRARDDFLGVASHELKTPLAALLWQLEGLVCPGKLAELGDAAARERLHKALANARRLAVLVERMLDASRLGQRPVPIEVEPVALGALAREVLARLGDQLEEAGCTTTLRERGEPVGAWDRSRLDQVLTNLLMNAARHAPGAPIEVDVWIDEGHAMLSVRDHGPGIAPADRERIFERFVQLRGGHPEGFGLGLWIVRQIVAAHGGEVGADEGEGGGARFVVRLPLHPHQA